MTGCADAWRRLQAERAYLRRTVAALDAALQVPYLSAANTIHWSVSYFQEP